MRLLNVETFKLESYDELESCPPYVILSHRWGDHEVLYQDLQELPNDKEVQDLQNKLRDMEQRFENLERRLASMNQSSMESQRPSLEQVCPIIGADKATNEENNDIDFDAQYPHLHRARKKKSGWSKIYNCCREAQAFGLSHIWVDTCCINKESSSELSEAINSMFSWYGNASICIAYLGDVRFEKAFENVFEEFDHSEWFSRGWTLQELIAPDDVWFYSNDWRFLGLRSSLTSRIALLTHIGESVLHQSCQARIREFSVAARLSWAARRSTTRSEDRVYSLFGIFSVHMPTIYGEGETAAFFRLQVEIFNTEPDHSIFAWAHPKGVTLDTGRLAFLDHAMFASYVEAFRDAGSVIAASRYLPENQLEKLIPAAKYSQYAHGLRVLLLLRPHDGRYLQASLGCTNAKGGAVLTILLREIESGCFVRVSPSPLLVHPDTLKDPDWSLGDIFIFPKELVFKSRNSHFWFPKHHSKIQLEDSQLVNFGFDRISSSLEEPVTASTSRIVSDYAATSMFNLLAGTKEFPSKLTGFTGLVEMTPFSLDLSCTYLSKSQKTLFAVIFNRRSRGFTAAIIEPSSTQIKAEHVGLGFRSTILENKWHILVRRSSKNDELIRFHLATKPPI